MTGFITRRLASAVLLLFAANYRELRRASPGTPANR